MSRQLSPTRIVATAVAALALVATSALPAFGHSTVEQTVPASGATLTELPEAFSVTADEALLDLGGEGSGFVMVIRDADGLYYGDSCATVDGDTMSTPATLGDAGDYIITWQLISADGHPLSGTVDFAWAPAGEHAVTEGTTAPGACAGADQNAEAPHDDAESDAAASALPLWIAGGIAAAAILAALVFVLVNRAKRSQY